MEILFKIIVVNYIYAREDYTDIVLKNSQVVGEIQQINLIINFCLSATININLLVV